MSNTIVKRGECKDLLGDVFGDCEILTFQVALLLEGGENDVFDEIQNMWSFEKRVDE